MADRDIQRLAAWEARLVAEGGVEALRAKRREANRRYWARYRREHGDEAARAKLREQNRAYSKAHPTSSRDHARRRMERRRAELGPDGMQAYWRDKNARARQYAKVCPQCGVTYSTGHKTQVYCGLRCSGKVSGALPKRQRPRIAGIGKSCAISVGDCDVCGALFTRHGSGLSTGKRCSTVCKKAAAGRSSREYQRRTHATAIRYWKIEPTPDALEVARLYFGLRQDLRAHRRARAS